MLNQAQANVVYKPTGVANPVNDGDRNLSPQVGIGGTFTAIFEIDDTALNTGAFSCLIDLFCVLDRRLLTKNL